MKHLLLALLAFTLAGCAMFSRGTQDYIPIGPQNLSQQVQNPKNMPIFLNREDIKKLWAAIGLLRIKDLPNDRDVIKKEIDNIKKIAASKGANAIVLAQYYDDNNTAGRPITLAAYLVKYLENISPEDKAKIDEFAALSEMENNANI